MWVSQFRSWEMVVPRNLNDYCSRSAVHDGEWGESRGVSSEIHDHLHSCEHVQLQVVKTAPDSQLLKLLSVSRLVTILNEADDCGVICKLQELDRGDFRCAVVGVEGEEQWGENTALRSFSADCTCDGWISPASLAAAYLSGSWWSTDRQRWGRRAVSVYSEGCPGWWC